MIIIQIFSTTPRAKRKVLKNEKNARGARDIAFTAIFVSQLIC